METQDILLQFHDKVYAYFDKMGTNLTRSGPDKTCDCMGVWLYRRETYISHVTCIIIILLLLLLLDNKLKINDINIGI